MPVVPIPTRKGEIMPFKDSFREEGFFRMVQKICESCDKVISFSGYITAQVLHEGGRFICMPCRRKARGTKVGDRRPIPGV
jgi:hypothetical protein